MMNRVIKRMQRGGGMQQKQQQQPSSSSSSQRPTLRRGNKSYSDSTMETVTSDQNSIPSNSNRENTTTTKAPARSKKSSGHPGTCSEEISEDETTIHSTVTDRKENDSSTHDRKLLANSNHTSQHTTAVCFAMDYGSPPEIIPSNMSLSEDDLLDAFYTSTELNSFDRDRALTVLMYQTRQKSVAWDDNEHSLRGLEEYVDDGTDSNTNNKASSSSSSSSSRRNSRKDLIQSVLNEQRRLRDTEDGKNDVLQASKASGMSPEDLMRELLRGVSFSSSKYDRQRAIQIAQKDEREVDAYNPRWKANALSTNNNNQSYMNITSIMTQFTPNSRRRYLSMVKNRINDWSNTSNKSISSTGTCGDRSTTSSTTGNHVNDHLVTSSHMPTTLMPSSSSSSLQSRNNNTGRRSRTRKKIVRINSNDDCSVTSDQQPCDCCNNNHNGGNESDDNIDDEDFYTALQLQRPNEEDSLYHKDDTSPLSIIQQVVYETSREFNCDDSI